IDAQIQLAIPPRLLQRFVHPSTQPTDSASLPPPRCRRADSLTPPATATRRALHEPLRTFARRSPRIEFRRSPKLFRMVPPRPTFAPESRCPWPSRPSPPTPQRAPPPAPPRARPELRSILPRRAPPSLPLGSPRTIRGTR